MATKRFTRADAKPPQVRRQGPEDQQRAMDFGSLVRSYAKPGPAGELKSPYFQHPYVHGALRLIGQKFGGVPFCMVRDDPAVETIRADIKASKTPAALAFNLRRLAVARDLSPRRVGDCLRNGKLRAAETPVVKVPTSPFQALFDTVNPESSRSELFMSLPIWLLLEGNTVWVLVGAGENLGENEVPREIWPTKKDGWSVEFADDGQVKAWVRKLKKGSAGQEEVRYLPHEIVHFRAFDPDMPQFSRAPLLAAWSNMEQDTMAGEYNRTYFENGAEPGVTLTMADGQKSLTDKETATLRRQWEDRHKGPGKAQRVAILSAGVKLERSPQSHKDMEFSLMLDRNRDAILACLTLHKAALGVTDSLNRATITEANKMVWSNLLGPICAYVEDRLYTCLFSRFDGGKTYGIFDLSGVRELMDDVGELADSALKLKNLGVPLNDINERLTLGLPEFPWGKTAYTDVGQIPYTDLSDPLGPETPEGDAAASALLGGEGAAGGSGGGNAAAAAGATLSGLQIEAAQAVISNLIAGLIPDIVAVELLVSLGFPREKADAMVSAALKFEPKEQPEDPAAVEAPAPAKKKAKGGEEDDGEEGRATDTTLRPNRRKWWEAWWRAVGAVPEQGFTADLKTYWYALRKDQMARVSKLREVLVARAAPKIAALDAELDQARAATEAFTPDARAEASRRVLALEASRGSWTRRGGEDLLTEMDVDQVLFDGEPWRERMVSTAEPHWDDAAERSLKRLEKEIADMNFKLTDPAWQRFLEGKRVKVAAITDRAREMIRDTMIQAVNEGKTITQVQEDLRDVFNKLAQPARRLTIARTEIAQASNGVRFLGFRASDVKTVSWVTSGDEFVRETHTAYEDLGTVPLGANFMAETGRGGTLHSPSDPAGPPEEIVNCRCTLVAED